MGRFDLTSLLLHDLPILENVGQYNRTDLVKSNNSKQKRGTFVLKSAIHNGATSLTQLPILKARHSLLLFKVCTNQIHFNLMPQVRF